MEIEAKKSLGQNFLINKGILDKIVEALNLDPSDTVIEIGPGTGNLTQKLITKAGKVIAIEKDHRLLEPLRQDFPEVEFVEADVLEYNPNLEAGSYKLVGNIPYYITSYLIRLAFTKWPKPKLIVLTIQKEVAERIVAEPPDMNLLALSVKWYADAEIIAPISAGSFRPIPKVDSAIIKFTPKKDTPDENESIAFFKLIKIGFSEKRKQLLPRLVKELGIARPELETVFSSLKISPDARSETLKIEQWAALSKMLIK